MYVTSNELNMVIEELRARLEALEEHERAVLITLEHHNTSFAEVLKSMTLLKDSIVGLDKRIAKLEDHDLDPDGSILNSLGEQP